MILGIQPDKLLAKSIRSEGRVLNFCPLNKNTCCSLENYEFIQQNFIKGTNILDKQFQIFQELFLLFKGNKISQNLDLIMQNPQLMQKCLQIIKSSQYFDEVENMSDFLKLLNVEFYSKLKRLIEYIEHIKIKVKRFHGNLICAFCDPFNVTYITTVKDKSTINIDSGTCYEILDMQNFEFQMAYLYEKYIKTIVHFTLIMFNVQAERPDLYLKEYNLNIKPLIEQEENYYDCLHDFDIKQYRCKAYCNHKSLFRYEFQIDFLEVFSNALNVLLTYLNRRSLNDYYEKFSEGNLEEVLSQKQIVFYPVEESTLNFQNLITNFQQRGMNIYNFEMNLDLFLQSFGLLCKATLGSLLLLYLSGN